MSKAIENIIQAVATINQNAAHLQNTLGQLRAHKSTASQAARIAQLEGELAHERALSDKLETKLEVERHHVKGLTDRTKELESKIASMDALYLKAAQIATDAQRRADCAEKALKYAMQYGFATTGDVYGSGAGELESQDAGIHITYSDTQK